MSITEKETTFWEQALSKESFSWTYFQFVLKAKEPLFLPPYKGSTLRGGFGNSFRRVCCTVRNEDCGTCLLNKTCPYSYIFETPLVKGMEFGHQAANLPHPFIIEPPETKQTEFQAGDELTFGLVLIGKSLSFLPYFVYTFDQLGQMGIGKGRGKFELTTVYAVEDLFSREKIQIYDSKSQILNGNFKTWNFEDLLTTLPDSDSETMQLKFVTPTRIIQNSKLIDKLPFDLFIRNLLRRVSLLGKIHCDSSWELPYKDIIQQAGQTVASIKNEISWVDWERYSNRQKTRMKFGGISGTITFKGQLMPYLPLIYLGQFTHIGKNTTFGLGKYIIN